MTPPNTPSTADESTHSRGQLLVATAIILAGSLVVLIVVLNSGLYTGTVATITQDTEQRAAQSYVQAVESDLSNVGTHIDDGIVVADGISDRETVRLESRLTNETTSVSDTYRRLYYYENVDASFSVNSPETAPPAVVVSQTTPANFSYTNADRLGGSNALITGGTEPEALYLRIQTGSLNTSTNDPFKIHITGYPTGGTQTYEVYSSGSDAVIEDPGGSTCRIPQTTPTATGNLVAGEINGCQEISWPYTSGGVSAFTELRFENPTAVTGEFAVVTRDAKLATPFRVGASETPRITANATYPRLNATVRYRTASVDVRQDITVIPDRHTYIPRDNNATTA